MMWHHPRLLMLALYLQHFSVNTIDAATREYYLAAVEIEWDYAPTGRDLVTNEQSEADIFLKQGPTRIGSIYTKAVFRQYTDATYSRQVPHDQHLGIVGPILRAETGDIVVIHFRNFATASNFSVHPHGIQYFKNSEGARYLDNTYGSDKADDGVAFNNAHTYVWNLTESFAPTRDDANCLPWAYHSHTMSERDVDTGLLGVLVTCKPGILTPDGRRRDVDREVAIYMDIADEEESWYFDRNIQRCGNVNECRRLHDEDDSAFLNSNRMHHINGYMYGHLPGLDVCEGERVAWYMLELNLGYHTVHTNGQTLVVNGHRLDSVPLNAATFLGGIMIPVNPGRWLLICRNQDHYDEGMKVFLNVYQCARPRPPITQSLTGRVRRYYIAVEEMEWDYAPSGMNLYQDGRLDVNGTVSSRFFRRAANRIGGRYIKARYIEYTDATFSYRKQRDARHRHLGIMGAPIKAEVGDTIEVILLNRASRPYSLMAHGVVMDKNNEGAFYINDPSSQIFSGAIVHPGGSRTYRFLVPDLVSPTEFDTDCITYMYQSAVNLNKDFDSGLIGPMLICKRGTLDAYGNQLRVDREFFIFYGMMDENNSWYIEENLQRYTQNPASIDRQDNGFEASNRMKSINGRMYGNLEGLDMCLGETVSWHIFGMGHSFDMYGFEFKGNNFQLMGTNRDSYTVIPGQSLTALMRPDNPGRWSFTTTVFSHLEEGASSLYNVRPCGNFAPPPPSAQMTGYVRRYYIAAVEIDWDYVPIKLNLVTGQDMTDPDIPGYKFVRSDDRFIGTVYKKAVFREFTDSTFMTEKVRGQRDIHLGVLGPFIRAEVGDTIEVVFLNRALIPLSITPHGVFFDKLNDGTNYHDNVRNTRDNSVQPGRIFTYRWLVPERAGPASNEGNCIGWSYHSAVNYQSDAYAGLSGPLVTCRRGTLGTDGKRRDNVDREFATLYFIFDENKSPFFQENVRRFAPRRRNLTEPAFVTSNMMASMNGFIHGNLPGQVMVEGETVAWYVIAMGSQRDVHTAHFHGQTFIHRMDKVHRGDVIEVFPGTHETVEMLADNPGTWIYHCHVSLHMSDGMASTFTVIKGDIRLSDSSLLFPADGVRLPAGFLAPFNAQLRKGHYGRPPTHPFIGQNSKKHTHISFPRSKPNASYSQKKNPSLMRRGSLQSATGLTNNVNMATFWRKGMASVYGGGILPYATKYPKRWYLKKINFNKPLGLHAPAAW